MSEVTGRKKPPGKPFQKGQSGNPGGRPKLSEGEKRLRALTREQFEELADVLLTKTNEQLQRVLADPDTPALMEWMIRVIMTASDKGDYHTLDRVLDRLVGKVPDRLEHSGPNGNPIEHKNLSDLADEQLDAKIQAMLGKHVEQEIEE